MNQKNILNFVIDEIYQLESYVQGWRDVEEVPAIEKDIVQRKLQQVYDQVKHLNTGTQDEAVAAPSQSGKKVQAKHAEPEITVPGPVHEIVFEKDEIVHEAPVVHEIPLKTEPVQKISEPVQQVADPVQQIVEPVQKIVEVTVSRTQTETPRVKETPGETQAEKTTTTRLINETIKTRTVMDVSSKLKAAPIPSIQSAINLNDKFLFIRELFKNNNLLYNQTIERLNSAGSYQEAISIVEREFAWDMKDPMVMKLVELIKRKHNA